MVILKKKIYNSLLKQVKPTIWKEYTTYSLNKTPLHKQNCYKIYRIYKETKTLNIKESLGILIRIYKNKTQIKLHFISLKKYNNFSFSFFKESPNIYYIKV